MTTYALVFSIGAYDRQTLDAMNDYELYDLASVASAVGYGEADVLTIDELSHKVNDGSIFIDFCWLYFVRV